MATVDRNALAHDLEALGLKAIAGAIRKGTVSVDRAMRQVERLRDQRREAGMHGCADGAQAVLNRYWGEAS